MAPNSGEIKTIGRISPLIELGAGFHPELSGRENIYLNATILGLKRKQIDKSFKDIVDFAELWEFIDQPVKHYSSGMYMRLGFAVAVHSEPEILLVDEILAVGDDAFQQKCIKRMEEFRNSKQVTVIFVSHAMDIINNFCDRAIYINHSKLIADGKAKIVCQKYLSDQKPQ
jgi:ABC-2 type transport system ATP-binding protein